MHYCIVITKNDKPSFGTINVIPLTSLKNNKTYHEDNLILGNEIYNILYNKLQEIKKTSNYKELNDEDIKYYTKIENEISKMKKGSIALINQITTISKQRIYFPKTSKDLLANIHLSNLSLDLLDKKIIEIFTK